MMGEKATRGRACACLEKGIQMESLSYEQVREMLIGCMNKVIRNEPYLTKVDSVIGDGDHGTGMEVGAKAALDVLNEDEGGTDVYRLYADVAKAMQDAMGGASGMIFSTLFAGDAADREPADHLTVSDFVDLMGAGLASIQEIGHAQVGDKTMVDALAPAVEAMREHAGETFANVLSAAEEAAKQGVEATKEVVARFGRSKSLGERALGFQDAGATSTWLILQQMADFVAGRETADPDPDELPTMDSGEPAAAGKHVAKKIINDPARVVQECAEGFLAAFGDKIDPVPGVNGLIRKEIPEGKTALVIGGGSGHEPVFGFFLGEGLGDASASGNVFASPDPNTIATVAEAANRGAGIMFVYGNYAGDNLNFDAAVERLEAQGIPTRTVRVRDDVASAPKDRLEDRRGIAGDIPVLKIAGATCSKLPLEEAYRITAKARDNCYSIGVGLSGATLPGKSEPIFTLPPDEMEYGLGVHGEPGIKRVKMEPADKIVETLLDEILADSGIAAGDTVITYVNGLGSTTLMELMIMNRRLRQLLDERGIIVHDMDVNSLIITQEMAGASITLMKMDDELIEYYDLPCDTPYYKKP